MWLPQLGAADLAAARSYCDYVVGRCAANNRKAGVMADRNSIIEKIRALLSKTVENGALKPR